MSALLKYTAVAAALATSAMAQYNPPTQTATDQDKMKGIGLPIIFISFFAIAIFLNLNQLISAWRNAGASSDVAWVFRASLLCAVFSIFFYVSSAWAYGLVSTILAYFLTCISTPALMQQYGKQAAVILFIWFLILLGIPAELSTGLISATNNCQFFYGTYADKMCKDGWQTFLLIISTVQIALTFLCVLATLAASAGASVVQNVQGQINRFQGKPEYHQPLASNAAPAPTAA